MSAAGADAWARRLQAAWLRRGPLAWSLLPLALLYALLAGGQRLLVRCGLKRPIELDVPVLVVGNLVAGGAGKTPTVLALLDLLRRHGWHPGVVSRGYGRAGDAVLEVEASTPASECGDEPLLLRRRGGVPVCVGRDRVQAGRELRRRHAEVDLIVSDDGLQHWRLARTAQVIVFDERGVGNGWLLPAGPLRESLSLRPPPRSLVLYNSAAPTTPWPGHLVRRTLAGVSPLSAWWAGDAAREPLTALCGRPLVAVAGVARPERFFAMLRDAGLTCSELALPDHHDYAELPWPPGTAEVVLTEKDAVKLPPERVGSLRVWVAALDFSLDDAGEAALLALLPARR
ncbi:MAG: tetraacyldisaccharide 4'-kinase [Piscinibacter sp.]|nr:tetraacyldisaccharide 4'-kinase [Piscinibacter sp.]